MGQGTVYKPTTPPPSEQVHNSINQITDSDCKYVKRAFQLYLNIDRFIQHHVKITLLSSQARQLHRGMNLLELNWFEQSILVPQPTC